MKLGSLKQGGRDGTLIVVRRDLSIGVAVPQIAASLRQALEQWPSAGPQLKTVAEQLEAGAIGNTFAISTADLASPLPRSFQFLDGSVYLSHMEKARAARGASMPANHTTEPLIYQGLSDHFYGPEDDVPIADEAFGIDIEAEIAIVVDDVPMGVSIAQAAHHIQLIMLLNDWSLRGLTAHELPRGFGFVQSKPANACSPVAVTADELGAAWDGRKLHRRIRCEINGRRLGEPDAGQDMYFNYAELIVHAARTRALAAGTIIGAGTVSNRDPQAGYACLAEARSDQSLAGAEQLTPFLKFGDRVRIEMFDDSGATIFGAIDQQVIKASA